MAQEDWLVTVKIQARITLLDYKYALVMLKLFRGYDMGNQRRVTFRSVQPASIVADLLN